MTTIIENFKQIVKNSQPELVLQYFLGTFLRKLSYKPEQVIDFSQLRLLYVTLLFQQLLSYLRNNLMRNVNKKKRTQRTNTFVFFAIWLLIFIIYFQSLLNRQNVLPQRRKNQKRQTYIEILLPKSKKSKTYNLKMFYQNRFQSLTEVSYKYPQHFNSKSQLYFQSKAKQIISKQSEMIIFKAKKRNHYFTKGNMMFLTIISYFIEF
eukprot:TRINITY_DN12249_c0_g2_i3.p1 TRINITY_DN12249_c0_g2~~TRINITY_DN12249_c0_g2_i3.p1  ORF type:complete len:207 (+),score=-15.17 TRINITY_DN12249_c0_g2_i3:93-713(+)